MSDTMDDVYTGESTGGRKGGLTEKIDRKHVIGRPLDQFDRRKFTHDRFAAARGAKVLWHISKDDRMPAVEAGAMLDSIHVNFGIQAEKPEVIEAFNSALFFAHTINSGSVLQPARSKISLTLGGSTSDFDMLVVIATLGTDLRRFFRAFADETRDVNQRVLDTYDPGSIESVERHAWLIEVAFERGMSRWPALAHDSADKCSGLLPVERAALAVSKVGIFGNIVNVADKIHSNARLITESSGLNDLKGVSERK